MTQLLGSPGTPGAFFYSRRQLFANALMAASRVAAAQAGFFILSQSFERGQCQVSASVGVHKAVRPILV
jgi:hypothetical protein